MSVLAALADIVMNDPAIQLMILAMVVGMAVAACATPPD